MAKNNIYHKSDASLNNERHRIQTYMTEPNRTSSQYLIMQIFLGDLDGVVLDSVSVPLVRDLLGHQLLEDEKQQFVVVPAERQIAGKCLERNKGRDKVFKVIRQGIISRVSSATQWVTGLHKSCYFRDNCQCKNSSVCLQMVH